MSTNDLAVCARCRLLRTPTLGLLLLAACGAPPAPPAAQLHTLDALWAEAQAGVSPGADDVTLSGSAAFWFSPPFSAPLAQAAPFAGLNAVPAFVEGQPATWVTSEVWDNIPVIWVQPLYKLIRGFTGPNGAADPGDLASASTIFGIGPKSRFYSPYWQTIYVQVPDSISAADAMARFTSTKAILDSGLQLIEGRVRICSLMKKGTPLRVGLPGAATVPERPISLEPAFNPTDGNVVFDGIVDGEHYDVIDFGADKFEWNGDTQVVTESALFHFARRNGDNSLERLLMLPSVGGTGPLYSGTPARYVAGKPAFSGLWHEYDVALPFDGSGNFTAAPFTLPGSALQAAAVAQGFQTSVTDPATKVTTLIPWPVKSEVVALGLTALNPYLLRVATNPACFNLAPSTPGTTDGFPDQCQWLDSQAAVEANLPFAFLQDDYRWATCPVLELGGHPVPR